MPQYSMDDENDDDLPPPPLPMEPPPPSSTSASSQNTNPDIDETDFLPPVSKLPHSLSGLSEDFHDQNSTSIVEPPEGFLSSSPTKGHMFTIPNNYLENGEDEEENNEDVRKSPELYQDGSRLQFRRVRSNPSLSSLKVKMSVISSSGSPVASLTNLEMTAAAVGDKGNEYVVTSRSKLKS